MTVKSSFPWMPYIGQAVFVVALGAVALYRLSAAEEQIAAIKAKDMPERMVRVETIVQANSDKLEDVNETLKENQRMMQEILREVTP